MARSSIQFATSFDGTPIAYWSIGSGPPIILIQNFTISHAELEWEIGSFRSFYEALAERHEVIRLDPRTTGLSGSELEPSVEDVAGDVEAVADAMGHPRFDLIATSTMAAVGIRLATTERVGRLVLCDPAVTIPEAKELGQYLRAAEAVAQVEAGDLALILWTANAPAADADPLAALVEENIRRRPELITMLPWDGRPWLGDVIAPTLVIYTRDGAMTSLDQAREAAATIPDARLVGVEGKLSPYLSDREAVLAALSDFLGWESHEEQVASDFSVIVFTDIVASTEVVDQMGDEAARNAVRAVEELVAETAADLSGKVVKHLGDGSLLEFRSASNALDFARKVQVELADGDIKLRVGLAAGEPIHEDGDVHGAVVVVASRISDAAGAGEVFTSDGVKQLVIGKQYDFEDQGELSLKGFDESVRIWQLKS